jgi:hypothetical protein
VKLKIVDNFEQAASRDPAQFTHLQDLISQCGEGFEGVRIYIEAFKEINYGSNNYSDNN